MVLAMKVYVTVDDSGVLIKMILCWSMLCHEVSVMVSLYFRLIMKFMTLLGQCWTESVFDARRWWSRDVFHNWWICTKNWCYFNCGKFRYQIENDFENNVLETHFSHDETSLIICGEFPFANTPFYEPSRKEITFTYDHDFSWYLCDNHLILYNIWLLKTRCLQSFCFYYFHFNLLALNDFDLSVIN